MGKTSCCVCGRGPVFYGEGRWIDGGWSDDERIEEFLGKWVCCYSCYRKLLQGEDIQKSKQIKKTLKRCRL